MNREGSAVGHSNPLVELHVASGQIETPELNWHIESVERDRPPRGELEAVFPDVARFFGSYGYRFEDGTRAAPEEVLLNWLISVRRHTPAAAAWGIVDLLDADGLSWCPERPDHTQLVGLLESLRGPGSPLNDQILRELIRSTSESTRTWLRSTAELQDLLRENSLPGATPDEGKSTFEPGQQADRPSTEQADPSPCPRRFEIAYRAFNFAVERCGKHLSDKEAYEWLQDNAPGEYRPPATFETFTRNATGGRAYYNDRKNEPRGGRPARSAVRLDQIEHSNRMKPDETG